ncbi:MAG: ribonuclease HII [Solobacterium sp.]|nr:ribonuclease HII [Solobacterium sp.]
MKKTVKKICTNEYEHEYWPQGKLVLGIDEAGRGPLAGPLTVAGVIFPEGYENPDIYDSKSLSEKKREALFDTIREDALWFEILIVSEKEIDTYDIYHADQMAMAKIAMHAPEAVVVTDAMPLELTDRLVFHPVKGDQKSISVAAGSILAKVTRDRMMKEYDLLYPEYGFASNKGYGTKKHMDAIREYGITPIHRRSFAPVRAVQQQLDLFAD